MSIGRKLKRLTLLQFILFGIAFIVLVARFLPFHPRAVDMYTWNIIRVSAQGFCFVAIVAIELVKVKARERVARPVPEPPAFDV